MTLKKKRSRGGSPESHLFGVVYENVPAKTTCAPLDVLANPVNCCPANWDAVNPVGKGTAVTSIAAVDPGLTGQLGVMVAEYVVPRYVRLRAITLALIVPLLVNNIWLVPGPQDAVMTPPTAIPLLIATDVTVICAVLLEDPKRPKTKPPIATAAMSVTAMISTVAMIGEMAFLPRLAVIFIGTRASGLFK